MAISLTRAGRRVAAAIAIRNASIPVATRRASGTRRCVKPQFLDGQFNSDHGAELGRLVIDVGEALDWYKRTYRRPFMTVEEVLHVFECMGFRLTAPSRPCPLLAP